ncbi:MULTISPECIES: rRNA maturation RNase YbeY [unclassified Candidatus Frackibacter]|uniref:rRNA maturation RNase YbeY n=1 Tax=unclassified Candidatus Frackibacter TaxID=2648818 RepID=UPI000888AD64|nr:MULTISPECIES: rRNA maturation RNase YbeY [unclassified Candidatus Frackibacter]SDC74057.1 probable rRNA maturation factor [Candidatus Frackibacter sp. WG11]SEM88100.1 probable rRNA maturation factor [Candidatus Frackibacter sp. WG12]SFL97479.1 probable rRNA maturation factor [Candidatus Frackibacter sp. WG13]
MEILINNLQEEIEVTTKIEKLIKKVINETAKLEGIDAKEVSVALVTNEYIKELNAKYRDKDEPTDVLSFPLDEELLGDIIISLERAQKQANEYNHSLEREVGFLTVHGMLHLLGHDHYQEEERKVMRSKEKEVLKKLNLNRE